MVIFAAGIVTGRLTAPRQATLIRGPDGRFATSESALERLRRELRLTPEQEGTLRPLLEEIAQQMSDLPPASHERMEVLRRNRPRIRALLRPEQHAAFDRYVRESEKRFERFMRGKDATNF